MQTPRVRAINQTKRNDVELSGDGIFGIIGDGYPGILYLVGEGEAEQDDGSVPFDRKLMRRGESLHERVVLGGGDIAEFERQARSPKLHAIHFPHRHLCRGPIDGYPIHFFRVDIPLRCRVRKSATARNHGHFAWEQP